jgi:hypothetical protein
MGFHDLGNPGVYCVLDRFVFLSEAKTGPSAPITETGQPKDNSGASWEPPPSGLLAGDSF